MNDFIIGIKGKRGERKNERWHRDSNLGSLDQKAEALSTTPQTPAMVVIQKFKNMNVMQSLHES